MHAKTIRCLLLFIAVIPAGTCEIRADEPIGPISNPYDAVQQLQSKINELRKEGKNEEANKLEIYRAQAIMKITGAKPQSLPEIHADLPELPGFMTPMEIVPHTARAEMHQNDQFNHSTMPKEQRVRSLLAAAASLKAAGLEQDAARYTRMASQLAQENPAGDAESLRHEIAELRTQVRRLCKEVEELKAIVSANRVLLRPQTAGEPPQATNPLVPGPLPPR